MHITILKLAPKGDDRFAATIDIDGSTHELLAEFSDVGVSLSFADDDVRCSRYGRIEGTREERELILRLRELRNGTPLELPHTLNTADRWQQWKRAE